MIFKFGIYIFIILKTQLRQNILFNKNDTDLHLETELDKISKVSGKVSVGELIVSKGELVQQKTAFERTLRTNHEQPLNLGKHFQNKSTNLSRTTYLPISDLLTK